MRETLYLLLEDAGPDGRLAYAVEGKDGGAAGLELAWAEPGQLAQVASGRRLVLFAPATDVRLATVQVPARQRQKVLQAAPYALEEQLAEDVETLHFAIGARRADGTHPVAIVARERMEAWLAPLRAAGLSPEAVFPETLSLPVPTEGDWTGIVSVDGHGATHISVRSSVHSGFTCAIDELQNYLQVADPDGQVRLTLYPTEGVDQDFSRIGRPLELRPGHRHPLEVLARHRESTDNINLLQGEYGQSQGWSRKLQPWRPAAILAIAWVAVALANQGIETWQLGAALSEQDRRNLERFQGLYPAETRIVDLSAQTEQKLAAIDGGGSDAPWFDLMGILTAALAAAPGLEIHSVQFRERVLYLHLRGSDLQAFETMRQWFEGQAAARISDVQANSGTDGVQVRFKMEAAR